MRVVTMPARNRLGAMAGGGVLHFGLAGTCIFTKRLAGTGMAKA